MESVTVPNCVFAIMRNESRLITLSSFGGFDSGCLGAPIEFVVLKSEALKTVLIS